MLNAVNAADALIKFPKQLYDPTVKSRIQGGCICCFGAAFLYLDVLNLLDILTS
jgi:hypothetical protein